MTLQVRNLCGLSRLLFKPRTLVGTIVFLGSLLVASGKAVVAQPGNAVGVPSDGILAVTYSADGKQIAGGSFNTTVKIWNANSGEIERSLIGHQQTARTIAFAPHGSVLASGSDDMTTILWDTSTGKRLRTLDGFERGVSALKFSPDGNTLWTGSNNLIAWNVVTGKKILTIPLESLFVNSIDISANNSTVAITSFNKDKTTTALVFDSLSGRLLRTIGDKDFGVYHACFLFDGQHLAGTYYNLTDGPSMRVWDTAEGKVQQSCVPKTKEIWAIDLSPDGKLIATGGEGLVVDTVAPAGRRLLSAFTIWDLESGQAKISQFGSLGRLSSLSFSPDNKRLAYCDNATVRVIDVDSGDEVWTRNYGQR